MSELCKRHKQNISDTKVQSMSLSRFICLKSGNNRDKNLDKRTWNSTIEFGDNKHS